MSDMNPLVAAAELVPPPPAAERSIPPWRHGLDAARANVIPAVVLTLLGVVLLAGYYRHDPTHRLLERVAEVKLRWGLWFSLMSTATFGGLLPVLVQQIAPRLPHREPLRNLPFLLLFWGYKGVETDLFYRLQAMVFGDVASVRVVLTKLALDIGFFTTLWAVPTIVLVYMWKDTGFDAAATQRQLGGSFTAWYRSRVVPVLISNTAIWLPAVAILYSLPLALQLPFQNLVQCLSTLILTLVIARHERLETDPLN